MSELPGGSLGKSFKFLVSVVTDYSPLGIDGPISDEFLLAGVPAKPANAPSRNAATSNTQLVVDIEAVATSNGSPIRSYHVEIDNGLGGDFTELQGFTVNSMALSATKSLGVYPGRYYRFRYRAKNAIGWGPYSDIEYVLSARKPDTPVPPTITLWTGTNVRVVFYLPFNGASEITKAYIQIKTHDGTTY